MSRTKVAVIGLGGIAQLVHLPILSKFKDVEIAAVAEINKNRLNAVADKFNISQRFQDYTKMLDQVETDAVIIATPTSTHLKVAADCIPKQKFLFIEKPIARIYSEAKTINELAKKYKCKVMVGMNQRFRPDAMLLKSLVTTNELGDLFFVKCGWARKQSSHEKWMLKKSESGGGVLLDLGIVILDLALWILDYPQIETVSAQYFFHNTKEVEDSAVIFIRCKNSTVINLEVSWTLYSEKQKLSLVTYGTKGIALLNPLRAYKRINEEYIDYSLSNIKDDKNLFKRSYENELKHFIGGVRGIHPFLCTSEDAVLRMSIMDLIYKSAQSESEVKSGGGIEK